MQADVHELWIDGRWCTAHGGQRFELRARRAPFAVRGSWARAGQADLRAALSAAGRAAGAWERTTREERLATLARALDGLEREFERGALAPALAAGLGVDESIVHELLGADLLSAREALETLRDGGEAQSGIGLFLAHWSDRVGPLFARLAARLAGGACVVLVGDPRLPEAADALTRALEEAGLPGGVLALLHDDGRTLLRAARGEPALAFVRECTVADAPADEHPLEAVSGAPFGAGLCAWTRWPLASRVHVVNRDADPLREAKIVLEQALGPSDTLFGQLPGAIGRVLCHQRHFASFSAELLAGLDARAELAAARTPVEPDLVDWLEEAWSLGLDEGAAPIFGEAPGAGLEPAGELTSKPPRTCTAILFTNVEPTGRLLRLGRPAPLLRLARLATDGEARALARELQTASGPATTQTPMP